MTGARLPRKLWKIGDIAAHTKLSRQTIHNYSVLGFLTEEDRTPAGHRLFPDAVFKEIAQVERLKARGKTLGEIARLLARRRARAHGARADAADAVDEGDES